MKRKWIVIAIAGAGVLFGAVAAAARSYNPIKWIKKGPPPTATQELKANADEERKLTLQLQALLPPRTSLLVACTEFRTLDDCVAALHVSRNANIKFNCLKWDMTAVRPSGDVKACEAPPRDKALPLDKAIRFISQDVDARAQAKSALRRAREDIKDAGS
jgi:hypothetical protein